MAQELEALVRPGRTRSSRHDLRIAGMIPAVVYGKNIGSRSIAFDAGRLLKIIQAAGANVLIDLKISENGKTSKHKVLLKEIQRDPVSRKLIHADFHQVSMKEKVHASVPVQLTGEAPGVAAGGVVRLLARQLEVECQAARIPEAIIVDVSNLGFGETVTVASLTPPPEVRFTGDQRAPVVTVTSVEKPLLEEEPVAVGAGDEQEETADLGTREGAAKQGEKEQES